MIKKHPYNNPNRDKRFDKLYNKWHIEETGAEAVADAVDAPAAKEPTTSAVEESDYKPENAGSVPSTHRLSQNTNGNEQSI